MGAGCYAAAVPHGPLLLRVITSALGRNVGTGGRTAARGPQPGAWQEPLWGPAHIFRPPSPAVLRRSSKGAAGGGAELDSAMHTESERGESVASESSLLAMMDEGALLEVGLWEGYFFRRVSGRGAACDDMGAEGFCCSGRRCSTGRLAQS